MVNLSSLIHSKSWVKNIAWVFGIIRCNVLVDILVKCQSRYSLRSADTFPVVASLPPKNSVCEPEQQNDFHDVEPF